MPSDDRPPSTPSYEAVTPPRGVSGRLVVFVMLAIMGFLLLIVLV